MMNSHNFEQKHARLVREIKHFRAQISKFSDPQTPRQQAALTLSSRKLVDRERQLKLLIISRP